MTQTGVQSGRVRQRTHEGFLRHKGFRWAIVATGLCVAAIGVYFFAAQGLMEPPSGGSWLGYILGTVSAGLIVWLACLGVRKRAVSDGYYSLKAWVSAHVYLGLSLTVLATLHTGFQFGWNVHTLAYALMMLVIASGGFGIWAYTVMPHRLSANRGEITRRQMLDTLESLDAQLQEAAQPLDRAGAAIVRHSVEDTQIGGAFWQRLSGNYGDCANKQSLERIRTLSRTGASGEVLVKIEELMQQKADALALARRQMRITGLLEVWLFVHIQATFALLAALIAHIVSVFAYW